MVSPKEKIGLMALRGPEPKDDILHGGYSTCGGIRENRRRPGGGGLTKPETGGRTPGGGGTQAGFTLLELMLSIMILAMLFVIVMGALRLGFRSVEAGEKKVESLERLRNALSLIEAQIESEIPLSYDEDGEKKSYFRGEKTALDFSTNYSIWGGEKGYVVVSYRVTDEPGGKRSLGAEENIIGQENRRETKMLEGLEDIHFEYYVRDTSLDPKEEAGRWLEEWVEEGLPTSEKLEKIRLHLMLGRREFTWIIPLRNRQGSFNTAGTAVPSAAPPLPTPRN